MAFTAINKTPGVYIDEVQLPGPIPGVGTSTVAFIGPARSGPINTPTFLTNFTQFAKAFGDPLNPDDLNGPYISTPPVFVTHAVRGFFDNGGATMYFVRVATAFRSHVDLKDANGTNTLVVTAKREGSDGDQIKVEVQAANRVASVKSVRISAGVASGANNTNILTLDAPATYLPGDRIKVEEGANSDVVSIASINGVTLILNEKLTHAYTNAATSRLADIDSNSQGIRLESVAGIEPGSYIEISQQAGSNPKENAVVQSVEPTTNVIRLAAPLTNAYTMNTGDADVIVKTLEFTLVITPSSGTPETYTNLSMEPRHSRYFASIVVSPTVDVTLANPPSTSPAPKNLPAVLAATNLAGGRNDNISTIDTPQYLGALTALEKVDDVNIVCIPDRQDKAVQTAMLNHCEKMQDRFAIFDPRRNSAPSNGINSQRADLSSNRGFGALYYPWIVITGPLDGKPLLVPPSGHVAGVFARTDETRGVFKPPANETLRGVIDLERILSDDENGPLNEQGINVIRSFSGRGILVWGARTVAPTNITQWRYVNVRRLLLFIEESIQEGTQFAVFEPNNEGLWATVKRQVSDFLTRVWRDGGLVGTTPDEAFRVRIDHELNPPDIVALGQLIIEVRVAPVTPAEFVVFRIISTPGEAIVQE
ncbi:MAG TPA: phage tail sheath subtilisin-like domain-containing protein [Blastocatellia bacterium]|nr:phage tail sheath subtilisin-like domain-containing protein [Blastocatellia bacterium]